MIGGYIGLPIGGVLDKTKVIAPVTATSSASAAVSYFTNTFNNTTFVTVNGQAGTNFFGRAFGSGSFNVDLTGTASTVSGQFKTLAQAIGQSTGQTFIDYQGSAAGQSTYSITCSSTADAETQADKNADFAVVGSRTEFFEFKADASSTGLVDASSNATASGERLRFLQNATRDKSQSGNITGNRSQSDTITTTRNVSSTLTQAA